MHVPTSSVSMQSKPMKRIFLLALFALTTAIANCQLSWGDQGNGTYINPVLNADFSDPDVIRVGEKYYMVASGYSFSFSSFTAASILDSSEAAMPPLW